MPWASGSCAFSAPGNLSCTQGWSGDRDVFFEIDVLDGVEELDPFGHRALEGLASGDQSGAACALIDDRREDRILEILLSRGPAAVDEPRAAHVAIRDAIVADAIVRLIPGVLSDETSALTDSFQDGLLTPPVYTRPAEYKGWRVPEILLSGNDKLIDDWKHDQAYERTKKIRPDLLENG